MFVYFHWDRSGTTIAQGFYKEETAANYVIERINKLLLNELRVSYSKTIAPKELYSLKEYISSIHTDGIKSIAKAAAAINLYEDYNKHVLGIDTPLHTIQDLQVVE